MRAFRIWSGWLLAGTLLATGGCKNVKAAPQDVTVEIGDCSAPDVSVKNLGNVTWKIKDPDPKTTYIVHFTASRPPTSTPFLMTSTSNRSHQMQAHFPCSSVSPKGWCDYKYTLTRNDDDKPCRDPVVHVDP